MAGSIPGVRTRQADHEVKDIGAAGNRTGTRVTFKPDPEIFAGQHHFHYDTLEARFRELAFLNKGLAIKLTDERSGKEETFKYDGGLSQFVEYLNQHRGSTAQAADLHGQRRSRRVASKWPCSTPPARTSASAATPTTLQLGRWHAPERLPRRPDAAR